MNMKTVGIIAEYNPFHRGHEYHIKRSLEKTGSDCCVVVMSGDFVQRGEPAIADKYYRAECALSCGADLVLELPVHTCTAAAPDFALSAVSILNGLGCVDHLSFGCETPAPGVFDRIAELISSEPPEVSEQIRLGLREGKTYPASRQAALSDHLGREAASVLDSPNNTLAIEYLRALKALDSKITPVFITRVSSDHNDKTLSTRDMTSALSVRNAMASGDHENAFRAMPGEAARIMREAYSKRSFPVFKNDISFLLYPRLLEYMGRGYSEFSCVSAELSDRIEKHVRDFEDFRSFCDLIKTRNITYARVSRALLHIALGLKAEDCRLALTPSFAPVLGFNEKGATLMKKAKKQGTLSLITKNTQASGILAPTDCAIFEENLRCSQLYQFILHQKFGGGMVNQYSKTPIHPA